jgi:MoxR-like ATPase
MTMPATATTAYCEAVLDEIQRVVVGKRSALTLILVTVLARGHVLIEDLPGLGKTLIARSFAAALGLRFTRVQFTPDLLPADLLGTTIYDMQSGRFEFRPGPIFTNLLLGDEINRTPPKTQAALLEAMAEGQVSIDGVTHRLPTPFIVLATDNPIEYEGTYPLPEAQLDRFTIRLELRYLSEREEATMLRRRLERGSAEPTVHQVVDASDLLAMRESVEQVTVHEDVLRTGRRRRQPTSGTRSGPTGAGPCPVVWTRLRNTRGCQDARRPGHGAPNQLAAGDVGTARSQFRCRRGTVAALAGSACPWGNTMTGGTG